ncbi:hypothetical protein D3H65_19790 [Paraflavitalea soli]|uniref:Uncharacterized protein n=1 Tax=Paraflavitalea soli TaxID=2315862 RepID=A0A3B7MPK3_9BACT|nr:hypothetical protein [Paraflavitalea soli]AXY76088.1 hypothetical protein D3H65_19790 [Paraflavitalea soli]
MKKFITPILAVVLGSMIPAAPVKLTCYYFIYDGTGPQNDMSNYSVTVVQPTACLGANRLCWIKICVDDDVVSPTDFETVFEALDVVNDASNTLDDDPEKQLGSTILEKRF